MWFNINVAMNDKEFNAQYEHEPPMQVLNRASSYVMPLTEPDILRRK